MNAAETKPNTNDLVMTANDLKMMDLVAYTEYAGKLYSYSETNFYSTLTQLEDMKDRAEYIMKALPMMEAQATNYGEMIKQTWADYTEFEKENPNSDYLRTIKHNIIKCQNILANSHLTKKEKTIARLNQVFLKSDVSGIALEQAEPEQKETAAS
jgi:hypothetical protein